VVLTHQCRDDKAPCLTPTVAHPWWPQFGACGCGSPTG